MDKNQVVLPTADREPQVYRWQGFIRAVHFLIDHHRVEDESKEMYTFSVVPKEQITMDDVK